MAKCEFEIIAHEKMDWEHTIAIEWCVKCGTIRGIQKRAGKKRVRTIKTRTPSNSKRCK
ncbi:MAG: hypothetical protein GY861_05690 [bacterium]|nr:hypothetical protein [bacterium]